jgi:integrase
MMGETMSVRKREWITRRGEPKQAWVADFVDNNGKRQIRTFAQKKKADAFHSKVKVDINAGIHVPIDSDLTVMDAADKWINGVAAEGRERSTIRMYRLHVKNHIAPRVGSLKLAKLTRGHIQHLRDNLLQGERKLSPATAHKVWVSFKSMLKSAHCAHLADNITIKKGKRSRPLESGKDIPTPSEIKRMVDAAGDNLKLSTFLRTAALTGLRASELLGLRWADVDLRGHEIHVRQRSDRYRVIGAPKSTTSIRAIPIGPDLAHALKQWRLACPKGEADLVFPNKNGVVWHYDNVVRDAVNPIMRKAGVVDKGGKPKYGLHAFRHFFASWCINPKDRGGRELPAKVVQEWLGHSSIKMTLDIYGHLFPRKSDHAEIAASEKAFWLNATQT